MNTDQPDEFQKAVDMVQLLIEASDIVKQKCVYRKFVDGTPLANDIAVWMAEFAKDKLLSAAKQFRQVEKERDEALLALVNRNSWARDVQQAAKAIEQERDQLKAALEKCARGLDALSTFHRHSPVWSQMKINEALSNPIVQASLKGANGAQQGRAELLEKKS